LDSTLAHVRQKKQQFLFVEKLLRDALVEAHHHFATVTDQFTNNC
jgi:hypothetical protein